MRQDASTGTQSLDIEDVFEELEELEEIVDTDRERKQVRETIRTLRRARQQSVFTGFKHAFGTRDFGEGIIGSFLVGIPMIVEDGTLDIGIVIAQHPLFLAVTITFGLVLTLGILHAAGFEEIPEDRIYGLVPIRLIGVLVIAIGMATCLMTVWGRVDWTTPWLAVNQITVVAIVMAVGASLGDILPE